MNNKKLVLGSWVVLLSCVFTVSASDHNLIILDGYTCVVENSPYHQYESDKGASYNYGSNQNNNEEPKLYRQDYLINDDVIRFEGWINPPANPSVPTRDRETEIISFLKDHQITVEKTKAYDSDIFSTVSLTEDANDMMARYRLGFMDEKNCPQSYLTDRVECIGQMIARKAGVDGITPCRGTENISTQF